VGMLEKQRLDGGRGADIMVLAGGPHVAESHVTS
jgi:hypothetical protein